MFVAWLQDCFIDARHYAVTLITQCRVPPLMMMTLITKRRGEMKARTGMRTQDPRLAQHCDLGSAFTELAAKGRRKARLLSARDALQSDPSSQKRGRAMAPSGGHLGAEAPSSQSRRHERKPLHPYYNDVLDAVQLQVSQRDAQVHSCVCRLHHPGVYGHKQRPDGVYRLHGGGARLPDLRPDRQPQQQDLYLAVHCHGPLRQETHRPIPGP